MEKETKSDVDNAPLKYDKNSMFSTREFIRNYIYLSILLSLSINITLYFICYKYVNDIDYNQYILTGLLVFTGPLFIVTCCLLVIRNSYPINIATVLLLTGYMGFLFGFIVCLELKKLTNVIHKES
jgi:hypothetical protein